MWSKISFSCFLVTPVFPSLDLYIDRVFITLKQMICFLLSIWLFAFVSSHLLHSTTYDRSPHLLFLCCEAFWAGPASLGWAATALHCPQPSKALLQSCTTELIKPLSAPCPRLLGSTPVPSGYHRHIGIRPSFSEGKGKETSFTSKG